MKGGNKMINKKMLLIPLAALIVTGTTLGVASQAHAQTNNTNPIASIVAKIAQKFGLKEADVQSVFDQDRKDRQTQMEAKYEATLTQDVKDGKITEAQKQLILAKHKELQTKRQSDFANKKNLTPEQRKAEMTQEKQDLDAWAKQNGIDAKYLFGGGKMGMGRGMGGHGPNGPKPTGTQ
jgi:hypothetical protein